MIHNSEYDSEPRCAQWFCTADPDTGMCINCGGEMFEEDGFWYHHTQRDIPKLKRVPQLVIQAEEDNG